MPKRRDVDGPPRDHVTGGWPHGTTEGPPAVVYAQQIAVRLADAIGDRSIREVARLTGLDHTTIAGVLAGAHWPDLITLAKCEQALEVRLWPDLL